MGLAALESPDCVNAHETHKNQITKSDHPPYVASCSHTRASQCPFYISEHAFNKLNLQLKAFKFYEIILLARDPFSQRRLLLKESLFAVQFAARWITPADYDAVQISHCQGGAPDADRSRIYPFTWLSRSNRVCRCHRRSLFWPLFRSMWRQALRTLV
jgi:hypothetical protein